MMDQNAVVSTQEQEKTYLFNIREVIVRDLDDVVYQVEMGKPLGNACFMYFKTIEWDSVARAIHKSDVATMTRDQLIQLHELVRSPQLAILTAVRAALNDYINNLLNTEQHVETGKNEYQENSN